MHSKMYIRIVFEDIASEQTKATMEYLLGSSNDTCLTSKNAHQISSYKMGPYKSKLANRVSMVFWHLDIAVLDKHFGGAINAILALRSHPGVASVEIMPIEGPYTTTTRRAIEDIMEEHMAMMCDHIRLTAPPASFNWTGYAVD